MVRLTHSRPHRPSGALLPSLLVAACLVVGAGAGEARAQRGIDAETFRPSLDGYGLLGVERAETSPQWDFGFKLTADYAHRPLALAIHAAGQAPDGKQPVLEWQAVIHVGAHLGFTDWLELALEVPVSAHSFGPLYGSPYDDAARGPTGFYAASARTNVPAPAAGLLDPRLALKARTRRLGPVGLGLVAAVTVPLGDDSAFLGETGFSFRPSGIVDLSLGRFALVLNVGAILRSTTTVADPLPAAGQAAPLLIGVGHELAASLGAQVKVTAWMAISAEAYALVPLVTITNTDGSNVADRVVGVLGALRFFPGRDLALSVGGGLGLPVNGAGGGPRQDAFRVVASLGWTPSGSGGGARSYGGSGDRDGDGVPDGADLCPEAAEDKDGFEDADGCPDLDNDGDGVPDGADRCPNEPEDRDGFQDGDGCPDPDNDGDGVSDIAAPGQPQPRDACPDEPEDKDGFQDDDGCPDPDNDGDAIPDGRDRCPDEAETANGVDDDDGCPDSGDSGAAGEGGRGGASPASAPIDKAAARSDEAGGSKRAKKGARKRSTEPRR